MLESEYITMENKLFPIKGIKDYIKKTGLILKCGGQRMCVKIYDLTCPRQLAIFPGSGMIPPLLNIS